MLNAITTKIEIDVVQATELDQAVQYAVQHSMPALVVHPMLVQHAAMAKGRRRGQFKIITTIDWPKGENYGMHKIRGMTAEMMGMDGFEIMVTGGRNEAETRTEAKLISNFLHDHISPLVEIRFVLGQLMRPEEDIVRICKILKDVPAPALIRTDHHLKVQVTKANVKTHLATMAVIRRFTTLPVKLSGNIDSVRAIAGCIREPETNAARFAVSLQQAQAIIRDLQQQPGELRELLEKPVVQQ